MDERINIAIGWGLFGIIIVLMLLFSIVVVMVCMHKMERSLLAILISILCLFLAMGSIMIIPIDIYNVSTQTDPGKNAIAIKVCYYVVYCLMLLLAFVVVPFAYFFYEADDEDITLGKRGFNACKYTSFCVIAMVLIVASSLLVPLIQLKEIKHPKDYFILSLSYLAGLIAIVGLVTFDVYTGSGLGALPISLLRRKTAKIKLRTDSTQLDLDLVEERLKALKLKEELGKKISKSEKKEKRKLELRKHQLKYHNEKTALMNSDPKKKIARLCSRCMLPIQLILGIFLMLVIILVLVSLIVSSIHRAVTSDCHFQCGFVTSKVAFFRFKGKDFQMLYNPLDFLLTMSSKVFPVDYILFSMLLLLILLATGIGLSNISIRFLCLKLYTVRWRKTVPQGLLLGSLIVMFTVISFAFALPSFVPQYATFGSRTINVSNRTEFCSLSYTNQNHTKPVNGSVSDHQWNYHDAPIVKPCYTTEIASIYKNVVSGAFGVFGIIFYFNNWLFLLFFLGGIIIGLVRKLRTSLPGDESDDDLVYESIND